MALGSRIDAALRADNPAWLTIHDTPLVEALGMIARFAGLLVVLRSMSRTVLARVLRTRHGFPMSSSLPDAFEVLGLALALGLLVGLQREHLGNKLAGLRTFAFVTLLGAVAGLLDRAYQSDGWLLATVFVGVLAITVTTKLLRKRFEALRYGMTTEVALMMMFAVGAYLVVGERLVAIVVGATIAVLLQFKPELHGIAHRLGDDDMRAIMSFALLSGVILPVLPNEAFGPFGVLNPFNIWLMAVLIVGISLGGYIVYKFYGERAGLLLGGILGGAISSTATTVSYAKRGTTSPETERLSAVVIMISSTVVFVRVLIEILIVSPAQLPAIGGPIALMLLSAGLAAGVAWFGVKPEASAMPVQSNPTELKTALVFAGLYALVLIGLSASEQYLPGPGSYAVAFLSGLTDMDAITLSTARLIQTPGAISPDRAARLIVLASMANLLFKAGITLVLGGRRLARRVAALFVIPMIAGGLLLLFW